MKKAIYLILALSLFLTLAACGGSGGGTDTTSTASNATTSASAVTSPTPSDSATPDATTSTPPPTPSASESESAEPTPETELYEITYQNARVWSTGISTRVQVIIEITNTGAEALYLSSGAYDLEDADGKLVASSDTISAYPSVIAPGEKAYYHESTTLNDVSADTELTVLPRPDIETATVENIRYTLTDLELKDGNYGVLEMLGRVENTGAESGNLVHISVVLYDADDVPIGLMFTILTEALEPGAKIGFEMSAFSLPDDVTFEAVARYEAFAYPMQMQL